MPLHHSRLIHFVAVGILVLAPATSRAVTKGSTPTTAAIAPAAATSANALDTPGVSTVLSMPSGFVLQITAGASGAPEGFSINFMKRADFDALGGWPDDIFIPISTYAGFDGVPTLHVTAPDFQLEPGTTAKIFLGELFDETGVGANNTGELDASTEYVVRVRAESYSSDIMPSAPSANLSSTTLALNNCTYTIGYWQNHLSQWPVTSLTLGTVTYNQTELLSILNKPAKGNGLISLAHQLIAAKLNIAQGASVTGIGSTIAGADALIGSLVVPPVGSGFLLPSSTGALINTLDQFNNGLLGVDHCSGTVVHSNITTLGGLRVRYR